MKALVTRLLFCCLLKLWPLWNIFRRMWAQWIFRMRWRELRELLSNNKRSYLLTIKIWLWIWLLLQERIYKGHQRRLHSRGRLSPTSHWTWIWWISKNVFRNQIMFLNSSNKIFNKTVTDYFWFEKLSKSFLSIGGFQSSERSWNIRNKELITVLILLHAGFLIHRHH